MGPLVPLSIMVALTFGLAQERIPELRCSQWSVHGYEVGMSAKQAKKQRKMTRMRGASNLFAVKEPPSFIGTLVFDGGQLWRYEAIFAPRSPSADALRQSLLENLGDPAEQIPDGDWAPWARNSSSRSRFAGGTVWSSSECDTVIATGELEVLDAEGRTTAMRRVTLVQLSRWKGRADTAFDPQHAPP